MAGRAAAYGAPAAALLYESQNYRSQANDPSLTDQERESARIYRENQRDQLGNEGEV